MRLAIHPNGNPWVITRKNLIYRRNNNGTFNRIRGRATDISIGANGEIFVIGKGGFGIYQYINNRWHRFSGSGGVRIAVDG